MIVIDAPEVAAYVSRRLGVTITEPSRVFGFATDAKRPLCAAVFNDFNGSNIEMTIVAEPGGISRGVIRYIAHYVFRKCGCRRLTVRTKKRNKKAAQMALRFGFTFEHVSRRFFPDDDAVVFRMLREECRWIEQ